MKHLALLLLALLCIGTTAAHGADGEESITVIATGVGLDPAKARTNAVRNAVEQAVGSCVGASAIVQANRRLQDEILKVSGDFIANTRLLSQETGDDGLATVKLEAHIATARLKRELAGLGLDPHCTAPAPSAQGRDEGGALLARFLPEAYSFAIARPERGTKDPATGRIQATIPITITWDGRYLAELRALLTKTARQELKQVEIATFREGTNYRLAKESRIVCITARHPNRSGKADTCYAFPRAEVDESAARNRWPGALFSLLTTKKFVTVSVYFKGKGGKLVESLNYEFVAKDKEGAGGKRPSQAPSEVGLLLRSGGFNPPNIFWNDPDTGILYLLGEEAFSLNTNVDMDASGPNDIINIEAMMSNYSSKD